MAGATKLRGLGVGACLLSASALAAAQSRAPVESDAMAFVRVRGDLRIEFPDGSRPLIERKEVEIATGSGFVVAPSGLIVTSLHVVEAEPEATGATGWDAEVTIENRRVEVAIGSAGERGVFEAYVAASDEENDLAVLQVTAGDLPYLSFGDSDGVVPGRPVKVLGFPFGRQVEVGKRRDDALVPEVSVTGGTLSAARTDEEGDTRFLQTDASVNPGNSGGPMLDEDGYVIGVVRMKLSRDARSQGAGFSVPVNVVKDLLETSGLSSQLPVTRLRAGVLHTYDWKRVRVELPDGFLDASPYRLLVYGGVVGGISFRADRLASPLREDELQALIFDGRSFPGFVPAAARVERERTATGTRGGPPRAPKTLGTALGTTGEGEAFRVEFAIVDRKDEKVAARFEGPADAVAFNLGLIRRALESLEADSMLQPLPSTPLDRGRDASFESVALPQGQGGRLPAPPGWPVEPASRGGCGRVPAAPSGLAVSHPADFTLVLRALRWPGTVPGLREAALSCAGQGADAGAAGGAALPSYSIRFSRLGLPTAIRGALVERPGETLLLEVEAPVAKLPLVEGLYARWVARISGQQADD